MSTRGNDLIEREETCSSFLSAMDDGKLFYLRVRIPFELQNHPDDGFVCHGGILVDDRM